MISVVPFWGFNKLLCYVLSHVASYGEYIVALHRFGTTVSEPTDIQDYLVMMHITWEMLE